MRPRISPTTRTMGSINCKEFNTVSTTHAQQNGTKETYKSCSEQDADFIEGVVCQETDINENEMKTFDLTDKGKILLVKKNGKLSALGTKCSHYGAPLSTGALSDSRIRCPWHGACFNLETGDIEDFPGLDSIPCYRVTVDKGQVKVRAKRRDLEANKRTKDMVKRDPNDERSFVIIGGGPSSGVCAETLRQEGYTGRIVMICKETVLPYDRIKLSKAMDLDITTIQFRTQEFYDEYSIETLAGVEANKVDIDTKTVACSNGYAIKYDKLYIATGSKPRKPFIPGADLKNVVTLRSYLDAAHIHSLLDSDVHVVCLGSSFISLEAAAYCVGKAKTVTVIGRGPVPLSASFGNEVGQRVLDLFKEKGVNMIMNSGIKSCLGPDGVLIAVELTDGTQLPCDVCIMGTGSDFCTDFLQGTGILMNNDGSVDTDMHLRTNIHDVYAGGDIANAPVFARANQRTAIGHYQLAQYHGRIAAMNMAGNVKELKTVPFFWTVLFGKSFRYSGYGKPHEVHIDGSLADLKFVAFYFDKDGHVVAMASCMRDPVVSQFAELQSQGKRLHKNDVLKDPFAWTQLIKA